MEETELISLVEEILEADAGTIALTDSLEAAGWDSLANISFIAELDQRAGIMVDPQRLADAISAADLLALVRDSLGAVK